MSQPRVSGTNEEVQGEEGYEETDYEHYDYVELGEVSEDELETVEDLGDQEAAGSLTNACIEKDDEYPECEFTLLFDEQETLCNDLISKYSYYCQLLSEQFHDDVTTLLQDKLSNMLQGSLTGITKLQELQTRNAKFQAAILRQKHATSKLEKFLTEM